MTSTEVIYLLIAIISGFIIAYFLQKFFDTFKEVSGIVYLTAAAMGFNVIHSLISSTYNIEEPIFFLLALIPVAIVAMIAFLVIRKIVKDESSRFY